MRSLPRIVTRHRSRLGVVLMTLAALASSGFAGPHRTPSWQLTPTGVDAGLRGLSPVSSRVAWASGSGGTVIRTVDGGRSWARVSPPDTETLLFRDVEA